MRNVAIDFECTKLPYSFPWQPQAYAVCFSAADEAGVTRTWFLNHAAATKSIAQCVREIQEYLNSFDRVIAHNLKYELHWLKQLGINVEEHKLWCTMVVEYLIRGQQKMQGLSLDTLCKLYKLPAKKDRVKIYWEADIETDQIPADILSTYCEQDALNAMLLFKHQTKQVGKMLSLLSLEMEVIRCYHEMEFNGMRVNLLRTSRYQRVAVARLQQMDCELKELLGIPEITNQWLSRGLFGGTYLESRQEPVIVDGQPYRFKTGLRKGEIKERTVEYEKRINGFGFNPKECGIPETASAGIYSVSKESLPLLKAKTQEQKRVIDLMYARARLEKLKSSYYDKFPVLAVAGMIHANVNQALTKTGRTSCNDPNQQNLPRGNNGPVKKCFVTRF